MKSYVAPGTENCYLSQLPCTINHWITCNQAGLQGAGAWSFCIWCSIVPERHSSLPSSHLPISLMEPIFSGCKACKTCSAPGDSLLQLTNNFQRSISWTWQFGGFICLSVESVLLKCSGCGWNFCLIPHSVQGSGTQETHYPVCIGMWGKNPSPSLSHRCRRTSKDRQIVSS